MFKIVKYKNNSYYSIILNEMNISFNSHILFKNIELMCSLTQKYKFKLTYQNFFSKQCDFNIIHQINNLKEIKFIYPEYFI